jgi:hypothetical protein
MAASVKAPELPDPMLNLVAGEFAEMPCMRLTMPQVRRLWRLDEREGERVVAALIARGILTRDDTGRVCHVSQRLH